MKVTCQVCGKIYESDADEICPKCGSYTPIDKFSTNDQLNKEASDSRRRNRQYSQIANSENDMADVASSSAHNTEYGGSYEAAHGGAANAKYRTQTYEMREEEMREEEFDYQENKFNNKKLIKICGIIIIIVIAIIILVMLNS